MMLTVHGLPNKTKFQDVEALIKQECNIPDFILDNLVDDGYDSKKVRIGLTNENDGYRLMKCLEGFRMSGSHVLKIVPVGKQTIFEPRSGYSNHPRNDYPNSHPDYSRQNDHRGQSNNIISSHSSQHGPGRIEPDTRHHDRGLLNVRQPLSQSMDDTRRLDHYQSSSERRPGQDTREPGPRTDFRDPSRGPLAPPSIRPAALDARASALNTGGPHGGMRGQDSLNYRGDHRQGSNPEPIIRQAQWAPTGGNEQWHAPAQPVSSQNTGYNYQQPQVNSGYGQQVAPRPHVLRSVEIVDAPIQPREQPMYLPQQKPITIMKDNFQGPTQYNVSGQNPSSQGAYQGMGAGQGMGTWGQQGQGTKQLTYDKTYDERRLAMEKPLAKPIPTSQEYAKRRFSPPRSGRPASPRRRSPPRNLPTISARPSETYPQRRVSPTRQFDRNVASITAAFTPANRQMSPSKTLTGRRNSPMRKTSPNRRHGSPSGRRISPFARKISPGRRISPSRKRIPSPGKISPGRRISPSGRRISPTGRRISPTGRRISPAGRRISPTGRRVSPTGRRVSPTGRRVSPTGRRVSPTGRRVSPTGRRVSPTGRRVSPTGRRVSPTGRRVSPNGKREEPRRTLPSMMKYDYYLEDERRMGGGLEPSRRYSPKRSPPRGSGRYSPSETKYEENSLGSKDAKPIRPAYEIKAQKYTGGFRPNETQYSAAGARNEPKISPWQNDKITYPLKKEDRDTRMGRPDPIDKKLSPRRSRSRSPVKDRYRRHSSPSPSPRSPRRSWALEKRQSPELIRSPPPPPLWPGQDTAEKPKHTVWERHTPEEVRRFDGKRGRNDEKYTPRFSPRREIDDRLEYRDEMKFIRDYSHEDRTEYRRESPRREAKLFKEVDKDFNDIYQRAVEFRRKTEELRKSNDRRNRTYDDESPKRNNTPPRADHLNKPKPNWIPIKIQTKELGMSAKLRLEPAVKEKRGKAVEEIANRILEPYSFPCEQRQRVLEELKLAIYNIMLEMFNDKDVSYIELVIKFRARYDVKDEEKILLDVLTSMPSHYKNSMKRKGEGITEVVPKISRSSSTYSRSETTRPKLADSIKNKLSSHSDGRSSINSKHESRKHCHGVKDGKIATKPGGLGWSTRNIVARDDNSRNERLLSPPYINEETEGLSLAIPSKANKETKSKVKQEQTPNEATDKSKSNRARPKKYYELGPLMNTMLEEELKNIMINVWQTLPDDANDEAEKLVIETFKNTAGDDLRNTIGLTVTKRLLNIHNGIPIKVKIPSGAVLPSDLDEFAKKYCISDLKYVQSRTYAGQMASWADLDALYSVKNLKCAKSRVSVIPEHKFMKCPPKLRTIYDGNQEYNVAKTIEKETARKIRKPAGKAVVTAEQVLAQEAMKSVSKTGTPFSKENVPDSKPKVEAEKNLTETANKSKKEAAKNVVASKTKVETKAMDRTPTPINPSETSINQGIIKSKQNEITTKTKANKVETALTAVNKAKITTNTPKKDISSPKTTMTKKPDVKTEKVETTKAPTKETPKPVSAEKEIVKHRANEENKPNANATKPQPIKTVAKDFVETVAKEPVNTIAKEPAKVVDKEPVKTIGNETVKTVVIKNYPKDEIAKAKLTALKKTETKKAPTNTAVNIATKAPVENTNKHNKVDKKKTSDFDELNDHDILAMLSSGIVLDECSGSDIE